MTKILLPPGQQLAAPDKWPLVGERRPAEATAPWRMELHGCVESPRYFDFSQLLEFPKVDRAIDIHCVTRWSKLGARFGGVLLKDLLTAVKPTANASFVSFVAHSDRRHSTSLELAEALRLEVLIAWEYDGLPLEMSHGGPVRVITPRRYFYKSLKWLAQIELLEHDRLGYWEQQAGYHNHADPWAEERYMAPDLDRREVQRLLASRDFSERSLRSLQAGGLELNQLQAAGALLRDADFRAATLRGACFDHANLSNSHFQSADLREASFRQADVEGADFSGADLRGADFTGASLVGASFVTGGLAARFDAATRIEPRVADDLTPEQFEFLRSAGGPTFAG